MKNIASKHEYFNEHLEKELDELNTMKQELFELKNEARNNLDTGDLACFQCWYSIYQLDYKHMLSYISKNNRPIKQVYVETLYPLQNFLFLIHCMNTISISSIFEAPFRLYLLTNLFAFITLCVQGELFIENAPNVYYTLTIGVCIFLFSVFLLLKITITLLTISHYQIMKNILTNE